MDENDLKMYNAFKSVLIKGDFEIRGEAVVKVASLFQWFYGLEHKIRVLSAKPVINEPIKDLKNADK